ncbi:MAG: CoA transferase [Chloroflexi bacterium]|nr:CoA transferase [Chloroflexota bacterium]
MNTQSSVLPLAGYRVVDFGWVWAGTVAGQIMADMGAEVIKIESRRRLDGLRLGRVFEVGETLELNHHFHNFNRNKKSLTLNISQPRAQELIRQLVSRADLVLENFTPGTLRKYGLDYEALREVKPDVVMVSVTAAGQTGPLNDMLAYAPVMQSIAGFDGLVGYEGGPVFGVKQAYLDVMSALFACYAALAALHHRDATGEGQHVDVSGFDVGVSLIPDVLMDYTANGRVAGPQGSSHPTMAPHGTYPGREPDSWIAIAVTDEREWIQLGEALGNPPWCGESRFADLAGRLAARQELDALLATATAQHVVGDLTAELQRRGVAAFPVHNIAGVFFDEHFNAREIFRQVDHPVAGPGYVYQTPWRFDGEPAPIRRHAPLLGEDNHEILVGLLGLSEDEVARLQAEEVVY